MLRHKKLFCKMHDSGFAGLRDLQKQNSHLKKRRGFPPIYKNLFSGKILPV